jgi:hypothetical protein
VQGRVDDCWLDVGSLKFCEQFFQEAGDDEGGLQRGRNMVFDGPQAVRVQSIFYRDVIESQHRAEDGHGRLAYFCAGLRHASQEASKSPTDLLYKVVVF